MVVIILIAAQNSNSAFICDYYRASLQLKVFNFHLAYLFALTKCTVCPRKGKNNPNNAIFVDRNLMQILSH